jgi:hypothetical protein
VTVGARRAAAVLALGLLALVAVRLSHDVAPEALLDGVVVEDPYRYLHPATGQTGDPTTATQSFTADAGGSPPIYVGTGEYPPQAQVIVAGGGLDIGAQVTTLTVTLAPIEPPSTPNQGTIAGNCYEIRVVDGTGADVALTSPATVVLRAPNNVIDGQIQQLINGSWEPLPTENGGLPDIVATNVIDLGVFAVVVPGAAGQTASPTPPAGAIGIDVPSLMLTRVLPALLGIGLAGLALAIWLRARHPQQRPRRPRRR